MKHDLDALNKAATQGEWTGFSDIEELREEHPGLVDPWTVTNERLACALVNAYRSGDLVPRVTGEEVREAANYLRVNDDGCRCEWTPCHCGYADALDTLTSATAVPDEVREAWGRYRVGYDHYSAHDALDDLATIDRFLGGDE